MESVSALPAWKRLKLQLRWIVFEDQMGNFVMVEPNRPKALGMEQDAPRPPMVFIAATDDDYHAALESLLWDFERVTRVDARHTNLADRVAEARGRFNGWPKAAGPAEANKKAA